MTSGIVLSKVFDANLYEVAGIAVNQCSMLLFFSDFLHDLFCVAIKSQRFCSLVLFFFKLFEVDTDSQKKKSSFLLKYSASPRGAPRSTAPLLLVNRR